MTWNVLTSLGTEASLMPFINSSDKPNARVIQFPEPMTSLIVWITKAIWIE